MTISRGWAAALALLCLACAGESPEHAAFDLREEVVAGNFSSGLNRSDSLHFRQAPKLRAMNFADELRRAVVTGPGTWRWQGRVPAGGRLRVGFHTVSQTPDTPTSDANPVTATLVLRDGQRTEVLEVLRTTADSGWQDLDLDLDRWRGREVRLEFKTHGPGRPSATRPEVAWAPVRIKAGSPPPDGRPNVLLIVVDTLRRDRLGCYGYARPTSPFIDRELAERGVTLTAAYAQASATLPSVASLVTSRHFGELMQGDELNFALPSELTILPEKMAELGYTTAGFVGNALLNAGVGFARGFETFYSQPDAGVDHPDAADLTGRARDWIEAHAEERFFVYLHLMDPHAPYDNPDIVEGRTPFCPIPEGQSSSQAPCPRNAAYSEGAGLLHEMRTAGSADASSSFAHPEALAHLNALYDTEVLYMDRHLGHLLTGIPPRVLANTLIILTADHGEELLDHGWWGHGRTTFEELVRVPFIARWDGHIPAGVRLVDTVRLLDLTPTLVAAAGGTPEPSWDGTNLLPALKGQSPLPRLAAFSQHGYRGPTKAMSVLGDRKLMLFNRAAHWEAPNPALAAVHELDRKTLPRQALFDLHSDPAETINLLESPDPVEPTELAGLERQIHLQLDHQIAGLRIITSGLAAGSRLEGRLRLQPPPAEVQAYFLDEADILELSDEEIRFEITGDGFDKGFIVPGPPGTLHGVDVRLDGRPLTAQGIRLGDVAWGGQPTAVSGLRLASRWPEAAESAVLYLWFGSGPRFEPGEAQDVAVTRRRLEALGYL